MMTIWMCGILMLGQQDSPTKQAEEWVFDLLHPTPPRALSGDPMRISSNNLLHALFGIPPLESARPLEPWRLDVGILEDFSSGSMREETPEFFFRYDATLAESNLDLRLGLPGDWEARVSFDVSDLLEEREEDIILARNPGTLLIAAGRRNVGFGDVRLGVKKALVHFGEAEESGTVSLLASGKFPLFSDPENLLSSGGIDFAFSALYTQLWGRWAIHVNVGVLFPGDAKLSSETIDTQIAPAGGVAISFRFAGWGEATAQVQVNGSVLGASISILDSWVATAHVGARFRIGSYFLETSVGTGLAGPSSDWVATIGITIPISLAGSPRT